ncbi:MAG TPA: STAS domain-containing protein [Candidatus Limnocylindrales bacterium]|nr:STAS domain-containing protein [Candidatus Limnocylindrales bacterium]
MDRVPILKIGEVLLVSIQVDMQDQMAMRLQTDLGERIVETGCRGVIIDITGLDIVDSFVGRTLSTIASISRVLDAETIVVGMRPAVAITLVELGLSLNGIRTAMNVERGMQLLSVGPPAPEPVAVDDSDGFPRTLYAVARTAYAENGQAKQQPT